MTNREIFNRHFEALKTCKVADVPLHSMAILESYPSSTREDQHEYSETVYKWAEAHAAKKPLLFGYAKLLLAHHFFLNDQYDTALPMLTETMSLLTAQNDLDGATFCKVMIGSIYRTFGNTDLALQALWSAKEQKTSAIFEHPMLACNITLAGIYTEQRHYEDAIPLFQSSLQLAEKSNRFYWSIYALHGLGKIYLAQKKYSDAKECMEKALAIAEKNDHPLSLCNSLSEMGNYYSAAGDYSCAAEYHCRALALRERNGFISGAITSCIRMGEVYVAQFKPAEAIAILEKGLKLAHQVKLKPKMFQIHLLLSEIYQRQNEMEKSLFHYKQYHQLYAQVELEDDEKKIKNAKMIFEAEQTRKENAIIKRQKEEIEQKNIELQDTIDALTRAKIGRKAKAFTLVIAVVFFIFEDTILHFALNLVGDNYFISMAVKMVIIFSLAPINKSIEMFLLRKVVRKNREVLVQAVPA